MRSLVEKLCEIRDSVACGRIELSTGLLHTQRVLCRLIPDADVKWINREVLGYLEEERQEISAKLDELELDNLDEELALTLPVHRTLPGLWLSWKGAADESSVSAVRGAVLCMRGVIELEQFIADEQTEQKVYIPLEYSAENGFAFLCDIKDLQQMHERIKDRLCTFITCIIEDLLERTPEHVLPPRL